MIDAMGEMAARMKERSGRKVMLVIGESRDRGSETGFQKVREQIERESIEVFGIQYSAYATTMIANKINAIAAPWPHCWSWNEVR